MLAKRRFRAATATSNPYLPPELLDHFIHHLQDTKDVLKTCRLVSKSWIPGTRRHLFAHIKFCTANDLQSWKSTFPNPPTSPTHYTQTPSIYFFPLSSPRMQDRAARFQAFLALCALRCGRATKTTTDLRPPLSHSMDSQPRLNPPA